MLLNAGAELSREICFVESWQDICIQGGRIKVSPVTKQCAANTEQRRQR